MAKESFLLRNLYSSTSFTRDQRFSHLAEESRMLPFVLTSTASFQNPNLIQGELFRYKKSSKELSISRWCTLDEHSFRYHKTQFSAVCDEKPLFELPTSNIQLIKALSDGSEYALEVIVNEELIPPSPLSTKFSLKSMSSSMTGRSLMGRPRHLEPRPGKYTRPAVSTVILPSPEKALKKNLVGVRENKISWTSRENMMYITEMRVIFRVGSKSEWERWQKGFKRFVKVDVEDCSVIQY